MFAGLTSRRFSNTIWRSWPVIVRSFRRATHLVEPLCSPARGGKAVLHEMWAGSLSEWAGGSSGVNVQANQSSGIGAFIQGRTSWVRPSKQQEPTTVHFYSHIGGAAPFSLARILALTAVVAACTSTLAFAVVFDPCTHVGLSLHQREDRHLLCRACVDRKTPSKYRQRPR